MANKGLRVLDPQLRIEDNFGVNLLIYHDPKLLELFRGPEYLAEFAKVITISIVDSVLLPK